MSEIEQLKIELENTRIAYQMAQEINQLKTGFLGRITHELRSPLSSLISLHQLILFDLCENVEEEKKFLEHAYQSAQKLLAMIDEIILVSKLDYGTITLKVESLDLNLLCSELQTFTKLPAADRNIKILFTPSLETTTVIADKNRLLQALMLLVDTGIQEISKGNIQVTIESNKLQKQAIIKIDIPCPLENWQKDPVLPMKNSIGELEQWKNFSENMRNQPQMKFLLAQTLFQKMGGELKIMAIPKPDSTDMITRLQGSLQLVILDEFDQI